MTTYYVGLGGNNGNDGLSWANRKLTLNGVEDIPVTAGDIAYIGPGVYRELLTVDVSGVAGSPIIYIADVTGEHTDGVGGVVRITGSDDDQTATRASCVVANNKDYRTFRGFTLDTTTGDVIDTTNGCDSWIVEDCSHQNSRVASPLIDIVGASVNWIIRRCLFIGSGLSQVRLTHTVAVDNSGHLIENSIFLGSGGDGIAFSQISGATIKNCLIGWATDDGIDVIASGSAGQTTNVNNCLIIYCGSNGLEGAALGDLTENYNNLYGNATDRTNTSIGANSTTFPPLFTMPLLSFGFRYPWTFGELSAWSQLRRITGAGIYNDDLFGYMRPEAHSKRSWGPIQFVDWEKETNTVRTGPAAVKLSDAGRQQRFIPVANEATTISVYVRWEADYVGTKPQMIIKQPGGGTLAIVTATGNHSTWEQLSTTLTPSATPPYIIVEFVSNNTANTSLYGGNFDVFFDDLTVS